MTPRRRNRPAIDSPHGRSTLAERPRCVPSIELGPSGRVVLEAKVLPNYLAASHTPSELIEASGLQIVGTRTARGEYRTETKLEPDRQAKIYLLSGPPHAAQRFAQIVAGHAERDSKPFEQVRQLDDVRLGGPETVVQRVADVEFAPDGRALLEAVFHPQPDAAGTFDDAAQRENLAAFRTFTLGLDPGSRLAAEAIDDGMGFVSVTIAVDAVPALARYTQLRTLRPLTFLREPPGLSSSGWKLERISASDVATSERIAMFDGGISDRLRELLGDLVDLKDLTGGQTPLPTHEQHGGWVVSSALFGHLSRDRPFATAAVSVDLFRVWPPPREVGRDEELHWVLDRIEEVLSRGRHRIAVITLAPKMNADSDLEPHRWTLTLDRIAREYGVLFCIAAGNTGDLAPSSNRLLIPADAINAISVGAASWIAGEVTRADYSSVGPGRPGHTTAPTGVQFGGDLAAARPFGALGPDGTVHSVEGTSLAAPLVARSCALLRDALGPGADVNLLRCLTAHSAQRVTGQARKRPGSTDAEVGLGRFATNLVAELEHDADAVTIVYRDVVTRGQEIALQFPFPDDLFTDYENRQFRLRWTFSCMPDIETFNPVDYPMAGFELFYRPHAQTFNVRDPDNPATVYKINRFVEGRRFDYLIENGMIASDRPCAANKPGWAPEVESRARDAKWESLIRVDGRPVGRTLYRPGLDLHFLTRSKGRLRTEPETLPIALAVTLAGPAGSDIYARVQQYAPALTPIVAQVRSRIDA